MLRADLDTFTWKAANKIIWYIKSTDVDSSPSIHVWHIRPMPCDAREIRACHSQHSRVCASPAAASATMKTRTRASHVRQSDCEVLTRIWRTLETNEAAERCKTSGKSDILPGLARYECRGTYSILVLVLLVLALQSPTLTGMMALALGWHCQPPAGSAAGLALNGLEVLGL